MEQNQYGWPSVPVVRRAGIYSCFPDLCRAPSGALLCVYRESDSHSARDFSHLSLVRSEDGGQSWSEPVRIVESSAEDGVLFKWNCPRIGQLPDGRLYLLCDGYPVPPGESRTDESRVFFWLSADEGQSWSGPQETPIRGIVPDRLLVTQRGSWIVATHYRRPQTGTLGQSAWRSQDGGKHWTEATICADARYHACEASLLEAQDGTLIAYMRENSRLGLPALKAISVDDGVTWEGPALTLIAGCHRPVSGWIAGDRVLITYRWLLGGRSANRHFYGYVETAASALSLDRRAQEGFVFPIDLDRSPRPDTGYSGWAVLDSGEVFCVNYLLDDFPTAQIRGYRFDLNRVPLPG